MKKNKISTVTFPSPEKCNECPCGKWDNFNDKYYCGITKRTIFMDDFFDKRDRKCPLNDTTKTIIPNTKSLFLGRFKVTYRPFWGILKIKDIRNEFKFKSTLWSDKNITMKYRRSEKMHWFDLGFRGYVFDMESLEYELHQLIEGE